MKTSTMLFRGIELIRERGWCQYDYVSLDGQMCIFAAPLIAAGIAENHIRRSRNRAIGKRIEDALMKVTMYEPEDFNNNEIHNENDAIATLYIAACCAAAEGN